MGIQITDKHVIIVGIICITILEVVNMLTMKIDSLMLSSCIGAIVFMVTRTYYKRKYWRYRYQR